MLYRDYQLGKVKSFEGYEDFVTTHDYNNLSVDQFCAFYGRLLQHIKKVNPRAVVLCSAIIPRYWDFNRHDVKRRRFNAAIQHQAGKQSCLFLTTYKVFFRGYDLKFHFYDVDGLHLSSDGGLALAAFFNDKLYKARNNMIY